MMQPDESPSRIDWTARQDAIYQEITNIMHGEDVYVSGLDIKDRQSGPIWVRFYPSPTGREDDIERLRRKIEAVPKYKVIRFPKPPEHFFPDIAVNSSPSAHGAEIQTMPWRQSESDA